MAGENEMNRQMTLLFNELRGAANSINKAAEKLSNVGVDKFTDQLKSALKTTKIYDDEQVDSIKSLRQLTKTIEGLESQYNKIGVLEMKARKIAIESLRGLAEKQANYKQQVEELTEANLHKLTLEDEEINLTKEQIKLLKQHYPALVAEIAKREKSVAVTDKLNLAHENLTKSIGSQLKTWGSFATAIRLAEKALVNSYDQLNRLSSKGMLGAFSTINEMSWQLRMTNEEFENLINNNRELVNQMGGGTKGIKAFGEEVKTVQGSLSYLGKEAPKAAARLIEMSKKAGLTPKDGLAYRKNLNESIEQFKRFSAIFGDSADDYANLMEGMYDEEKMRGRLNSMSKSELVIYQAEIRARTENLKWMGLQNQQIQQVNKTMNELVNPEDTDIGDMMKQTIAAQSAYDEQIRLLSRMGQAGQAQSMMQNRGTFQQLMMLVRSGMQEEAQSLAMSEPGMTALRELERGRQTTNRSFGDPNAIFARLPRNTWMKEAGPLLQKLQVGGEAALTAQAQGREIPPEQRAGIAGQATDMLDEHGKLAQALDKAATTVQTFNSLMGNPFVQALGAAVAGLIALTAATSINGLLGGFKGLAKGIGGISGIAVRGIGLLRTVMAGLLGIVVTFGLDKLLGLTGVGGNKIDETQDDINWSKMNFWEKIQSGTARGIENVGSVIGVSNISNQARATRVTNEISYLASTGRASSANAPGVGVVASSVGGNNAFDFNRYAQTVGQRESGGNYGITNSYGYVGKYQFGAQALQDVGLLKPGAGARGNSVLNDPSVWTIPGGLPAFLRDQNLQDTAMKQYTVMHYAQLLQAGVITPTSSPGEVAGYLAAAHLKGVGGAIKLKQGQSTADAYGTQSSSYFSLGASSQGMVTPLNQPGANAPFTSGAILPSVPPNVGGPRSMTNLFPSASATTPMKTDSGTEELKKQTSLLSEIAKNTASNNAIRARPDSYLQDQGLVMGGATG